MQEEIVNGVGSILRFVVAEIIWGLLLFNLGRGSLLVLTLGRYPTAADLERHADRISFVGVLVLVCIWSAFALTNRLAVG